MSPVRRGGQRPHMPGVARPCSEAERQAAVRAVAWRRDRGLLTTRQARTVLQALGLIGSESGGYYDPTGRRQSKAREAGAQGRDQADTDDRNSA